MLRPVCIALLALASGGLLAAAEEDASVVFRSEVTLVRVDAQVVDRSNRAITGLHVDDFMLREEGRPQQIRHFAREDMPVDVLLLLDVSGSMRPHVQRVTSAAHQALRVLGDDDRVAVIVFDRTTRVRLPFRNSRSEVEAGLEGVLRHETFGGGTDITRALFDATNYVARQARRDARRAIVILTDDQTERERDEAGVERALVRADAILSALLAPDAFRTGSPRISGGGSWPTGPIGGPMGGPLGGIIFGRGGPYGRRIPGPVITRAQTRSAGTAKIAQRSGGDSLRVDEASALERTLARIRQRYALHFHLPEGARPGQERAVEVELAAVARRRYPDAEVRFRRAYLAPDGTADTGSVVAIAPAGTDVDSAVPEPAAGSASPGLKRRPAVNEPDGPRVSVAAPGSSPPKPPVGAEREVQAPPVTQGGWRRVDEPPRPGWRRVKPGELP